MDPTLLIITDDPDGDPIALAKALLDVGEWTRTPAGWVVTSHLDNGDSRRAAANARQRAYRARRRGDAPVTRPRHSGDARDAVESDAGDAVDNPNSDAFGGGNCSLPTPFGGREGVSKPPESDAGDASPGDAVTRDAGDASRASHPTALPGPESWRIEPLTDAEREVGKRRSAEYRDRLRNGEL